MRTVTLGSLGAVAPIVPAGPPRLYGIGEADARDPNKTMFIGGVVGFVLGVAAGRFLWSR